MNRTKNLSDAYRKDTGGNLYKLLQLVNLLQNDTKIDLNAIDSSRDIHEATGKTLDRYGELVGESRNGATNEQYRTKILAKIARCRAESDCNSIITAIAHLFTTDAANLSIIEDDMKADVIGLEIEMLQNSGYKSLEIESMIAELIPIGVELLPPKYAGTLKIIDWSFFHRPNDDAFNELVDNYPVLFFAWEQGQRDYATGKATGLSGHGEVPESFKELWGIINYQTSGDYVGGTLGMLTGEDE